MLIKKNDTFSASSLVTELPSASSLVIKEILSGKKKKKDIKISLEGFPKTHLTLEMKKVFQLLNVSSSPAKIKKYCSKENVTCINESTMI